MELPHVGHHCSKPDCKKLDFLPIKCDVCLEIFCDEHYLYLNHACKNAYKKNNQVPVCPLCNKPVPVPSGRHPDEIVGAHIDTDCQSAPTKKVFTNKCTVKNCKGKEVIPVLCTECRLNFCLRHRHPADHECQGAVASKSKKAANAAAARLKSTPSQIKEDQDLARALALSMQEDKDKKKNLTQEEIDLALAKQLQEAEYQGTSSENSRNRDTRERCAVV